MGLSRNVVSMDSLNLGRTLKDIEEIRADVMKVHGISSDRALPTAQTAHIGVLAAVDAIMAGKEFEQIANALALGGMDNHLNNEQTKAAYEKSFGPDSESVELMGEATSALQAAFEDMGASVSLAFTLDDDAYDEPDRRNRYPADKTYLSISVEHKPLEKDVDGHPAP